MSTDEPGRAANPAFEIDGASTPRTHCNARDDLERDIDLGLDGHPTLRFPAWLIRKTPNTSRAAYSKHSAGRATKVDTIALRGPRVR